MNEAEKAYQYFVIAVPENEEQAKAYFWARKALQSTLTPPNEPLTIEQLREMDGEPVWVTSARERGNIPSRWVLFAGVSKSKRNSDVFVFATTGGIAQGYEAVNYGKTWNAYRRPPEGDADA